MSCQATIVIAEADERGVPTRAVCPCGWTWVRPDGDDWADTLPTAARAHQTSPTLSRVTSGKSLTALRRADDRWRKVSARYEEARTARTEAICEAYRRGLTVQQIAAAIDVSDELVRRTLRQAGL